MGTWSTKWTRGLFMGGQIRVVIGVVSGCGKENGNYHNRVT